MAIGPIVVAGVNIDAELILEKTEPTTPAGLAVSEVVITAILTRRRQGPQRDVWLDFFLNGQLRASEETNEYGRATTTFPDLQLGSYVVSVQARDSTLVARERFTIRPLLRRPTRFDAQALGDSNKGELRFLVSVYASEGGCKGEVLIMEERGGVVFRGPTDENGTLLFPLPGQDPLRYLRSTVYIVRVVGVQGEERFPLVAPPKRPRRELPPEYSSYTRRERLRWQLRNNNNSWFYINLLLIVVLPVVGLFLYGFTDPAHFLQTEGGAYAELDSHARVFVDSMRGLHAESPQPPTATEIAARYTAYWIYIGGWWLWLGLLCVSPFVFVFTFWDEGSRALTTAARRSFERRGGVASGQQDPIQSAGAAPTGAQQQGLQTPLTFKDFLRWEIIIDAIGEFFNLILHRR